MAKKKTKKKILARRFDLKVKGQGKTVVLSFSEMIGLVDRCIKKKSWSKAAYILEQVVSSLPRDRSVLLRQLNVYLSLKLMWKAYPLAKTLLELFPADKKVLEKAIVAFLSSGYTDEALALAEKSVKLYPGSDVLHNTLGLCHIDKGNKEVALQE
jgi:tetratricopeptide (TPR) repeat protein